MATRARVLWGQPPTLATRARVLWGKPWALATRARALWGQPSCTYHAPFIFYTFSLCVPDDFMNRFDFSRKNSAEYHNCKVLKLKSLPALSYFAFFF